MGEPIAVSFRGADFRERSLHRLRRGGAESPERRVEVIDQRNRAGDRERGHQKSRDSHDIARRKEPEPYSRTGTSPWRSMIAFIFAGSGAPSARSAAISRK
jgi:hypothetical protein